MTRWKQRNKVEDKLYQLTSLIIKMVKDSLTLRQKNRIDQKKAPRDGLTCICEEMKALLINGSGTSGYWIIGVGKKKHNKWVLIQAAQFVVIRSTNMFFNAYTKRQVEGGLQQRFSRNKKSKRNKCPATRKWINKLQ